VSSYGTWIRDLNAGQTIAGIKIVNPFAVA
jgi:hypothetical protein